MITKTEAYFLGLLLAKGEIVQLDNPNQICFRINIKWRRPNDEAIRTDNIYTPVTQHVGGKENLTSRFINDFLDIGRELSEFFGVNFNFSQDGRNNSARQWTKKIQTITSDPVDAANTKFCKLFNVSRLKPALVKKFPFHLKMEDHKITALSFVQGVCDACSLVPNEAAGQNGGNGDPRIQLEPDQDRWELCIGLCRMFQIGLGIRVNNINWGHPEIRTKWVGQNHQFRVKLSSIPNDIEIYRLTYKKEEYHNLYNRKGVTYSQEVLCPSHKSIRNGDKIIIHASANNELNSQILDPRLRGYSIDVPKKKSLLVCKLLGCHQCDNFFEVMKEDD